MYAHPQMFAVVLLGLRGQGGGEEYHHGDDRPEYACAAHRMVTEGEAAPAM